LSNVNEVRCMFSDCLSTLSFPETTDWKLKDTVEIDTIFD